ncbi:MAG: YigZ family protein, partial [Bacteroidales bacterium]|nr:YigZ family protein [Bacteroidales bacterium]
MLFEDTYKTIENISEGLFKDRGSKFIAHAIPVNNESQVKEHLSALRKIYHDARHHCYAYQLGFDKSSYRINDDGEPSGTAGKPIFGQILSYDLTNILIVVVRYFGGTKLG